MAKTFPLQATLMILQPQMFDQDVDSADAPFRCLEDGGGAFTRAAEFEETRNSRRVSRACAKNMDSHETSKGIHNTDKLWRRLMKTISRNKNVEKVIVHHEKLDITRRGRLRQPILGISSPESSRNFHDGFCASGEGVLLQKRVSEVVEALRFKQPRTGYNLLMYAAFKGRTQSFRSLVEIVNQRLGRRGLVKQLRESDLDEAPLLFQAASSSSIECLKLVSDEIWNSLGEAELRQQLLAKDLKGKTIVFHAARSQNLDVFEAVLRAVEKGEKRGNESWLTTVPRGQPSGNTVNDDKEFVVDLKERTVLHHACQAGCTAIVRRVIKEANSHGVTFLRRFLNRPDCLGRTAVMHVLRSNRDDVLKKIETLLKLMTPEEKITAFTQPTKGFASTALVHAVHGGSKNIEIARRKILELAPEMRNADGELDLDAALGIKEISSDKKPRYGALLTEAACGGYDDTIKYVVFTLQAGEVRRKGTEPLLPGYKEDIKLAIRAVTDDSTNKGTLFTHAIASGKTTSLHYVKDLIGEVLSDPKEIWYQLSGLRTCMDNLSLATSVSVSGNEKIQVFEIVYHFLEDAARKAFSDKVKAKNELIKLFLPKPGELSHTVDTPLVRSMSSNDVDLFKKVCETFERLNGGEMTLKQIGDQIPTRFEFGVQHVNLTTRVFQMSVGDMSPLMLLEIIKAIQAAKRSKDPVVQREGELNLSRRMRSLVQIAAERGAFDLLRVFASNDERLHLESIPILLERIGDFNENIMEAIMLSIVYSRNPFAKSAEISTYIEKAEMDLPMHRDELRHLQEKIDALVQEVLRVLPNTVKGIGEALAAHEYSLVRLKNDRTTQKRYGRMALKIGYAIVERILEPAAVPRGKDKAHSGGSGGIGATDPLQHALDRGSRALDFINSPLVLDYLGLKFSRSTPSFLSTDPFGHDVSEMYYRHTQTSPNAPPIQEKETPADILMRILQGWEKLDETGEQQSEAPLRRFPHVTLLPGLQFLLAGILGRPSSFYDVPVIRFSYELLSYLVMVVLFIYSVDIEDPYRIPRVEITFYVFVLGMIWREGCEFQQVLPKEPHPLNSNPAVRFKTPAHNIMSAVMRYLFQDAWNILDTSTIIMVAVAFVFRVVALNEGPRQESNGATRVREVDGIWQPSPGDAAFAAQALLAAMAPLLFARILSLSPIDNTLGPMTQIIWTMLSHIARFSVFFVVLIMSFGLTFSVLLGECGAENESYVSFNFATLSMFKAMLGDFDFDSIMGIDECGYQPLIENAATIILVIFLIIVAILLMNLLIAVLSTAHAEVYKNAEREFHLARAKLIQQSWRSSHQGRQPPPVNLLRPLAGFLGDLIFEVYNIIGRRHQRCPISQTEEWKTALVAIHEIIFSLTMGPVAGAMFIVLWAVSIPWVAWCLLGWVSQSISKEKLRSWHETYGRGYVRPLCASGVLILCWVIAMFPAALLSLGYVALAFPLWGYGILGISQRYSIQSNHIKSATSETFEDILSELSSYRDDKSTHFRVDHLVKMTTGLDLEELPRRIKRRDLHRRKRNTSFDSDDDMPDGPEQELMASKELLGSPVTTDPTPMTTPTRPLSV